MKAAHHVAAARLVVAVLTASPVWAAPPPRVLPARDVEVAYRLSGAAAEAVPGGGVGELHLAWDASGERLRVEASGQPQTILVDLRARTANLIDAALHSAVALPLRDRDVAGLTSAGAQFTRRAQESVAGLVCTLWAVRSPRGSGTVCLTEDGVALRGEGEVDRKPGRFVATRVTYATQRANLFLVPQDYLRLDFSNFGRTK